MPHVGGVRTLNCGNGVLQLPAWQLSKLQALHLSQLRLLTLTVLTALGLLLMSPSQSLVGACPCLIGLMEAHSGRAWCTCLPCMLSACMSIWSWGDWT